MNKVYINIHPNHGYSTVILSSYLNIKDYIREVSWTSWNIGQKRSFMVTGYDKSKPQEHLRRVEVVAQRLLNAGMEVLVRNERGEEWGNFEDKGFSEDYMLSYECEMDSLNIEKDCYIKDIEKYERLLNLTAKEELLNTLNELIDFNKAKLEKIEKKDSQRIQIIKNHWKSVQNK